MGPTSRAGFAGERPRPGWIVHAMVLAGCIALLVAGIFWGGFLRYADQVASLAAIAQPSDEVRADGIVVLTGGADRIAGAMTLLAEGRAKRLLISGVHPSTSAQQIGRMVDAGPSLFECCIDLDRRAANTIGNAAETAKWARQNEFTSLIVVTSAYHMPRALAELASAMPDVRLVAWPVATPSVDAARWWSSGDTAALLLGEYVKYMATRARLGLDMAGNGAPVLSEIAR